MHTLNHTFRKTLPALAFATIIAFLAFGLTSCSQESENRNESDPPVHEVVNEKIKELDEGMEELIAELEKKLPEYKDSVAAVEKEEAKKRVLDEISVLKAVACTDIENHEPVDSASFFDINEDKVWIYSKVKLPKFHKGKIQHVYYLDGRKIQTIELDVKGPTFRTRSYKTMNENLCGDWKVEILNEAGRLLDTVEFSFYEEGGC